MIKKLLALSLIFSQITYAGLPPTTSKGLNDTNPSVTFNYQFPGYPITHTGTTASIGTPSVALPNYVGLDATWANTQVNDRGAEASLGNWAAYNNTVAGVAPDAGMTGGTPSGNVLLTRTTTAGQVLDGTASFLITKSAFNVQGEGFSVIANVPPAFRTTNATITVPFKVISGTIVQGDVKAYLYDVTNSQLITPFNNDVVGTQGVLTATAALSSTTAQIRVGFHFASTVATALTLSFDDVSVGPNQAVFGLAGGNWTPYTPVIQGFTISSSSCFYRRVGNGLEIRGTITPSAANGSPIQIGLPAGLTTSSTISSVAPAGEISGNVTRANVGPGLSAYLVLFPSVTYANVGANDPSINGAVPIIGSNLGVSSFTFSSGSIPIASFDANVTMAQSSTFKISSILANGTRVTTTPTLLGQYRSIIRGGTDSAPTASPSAANGMQLYGDVRTGAGTAGQIGYYQIYVGKNKNIKWEFYNSTGKTGFLDVTPGFDATNTLSYGAFYGYDPVAGIAWINATDSHAGSTASGSLGSGFDATGTRSLYGNGYFDITVSENALAVGVQAPRSEVLCDTGAGHGITNVDIRTFTNCTTTGTALSYSSSASLGDSFTINEDGVFSMSYTDFSSAAVVSHGFSRNSNQLTTGIDSITTSTRLMSAYASTGLPGNVSTTRVLKAGDVIRAHYNNAASMDTTSLVQFTITKVSN